MSEYLHPKDWFKIRRGDLVEVVTPDIWGIYQIRRVLRSSNFPYRVMHDGEIYILRKWEVRQLGKISDIDTPTFVHRMVP